MERKRKIIAALADLKQEIAGVVPVDIISKWQRVSKTSEQQDEILKPYERQGYLVSTDSAGLSALTTERPLLEVMKIVSEPKEVIYALGSGIGGKGVGIWAADNSQMFYDAGQVEAEELLGTMVAAQKIISEGVLQVGMGIHAGTFWQIGQGMFGKEADLLEEVAENCTSAREIVISESFKNKLADLDAKVLVPREDLTNLKQKFFSVNYDRLGAKHRDFSIGNDLVNRNFYPFPFSAGFFLKLKELGQSLDAEKELQKYFQNKVVILIKVYHRKNSLLLDELTDWVVMNALINEVSTRYEVKSVKSNGELGIFVADSDREAVEFSEELLTVMRSGNDLVSIGLARGDVLLFDLDGGGMDKIPRRWKRCFRLV
jgi:hypothetical protein